MLKTIDFTPATEVLGHTAPLAQRAEFPLLGVPLMVRSNSLAVIAAAERSFGGWRHLAPEHVAPGSPRSLDVIVHPVAATPRASFVQRVHGDVFLAASGANLLTAQLDRGRALAFVTPQLVADDLHFRYNVLECLGLLLVTRNDRTPVHAGAVVRDDHAVLLFGPSTAGKSTLCYACTRAGFQLLAEDVVYVSLRQGLRVWGNPGRIHLLPDASRLFPELVGLSPQIQANGKLKLAIDLGASDAPCFFAERATVCLLTRHGGPSALEPVAPQDVVDALGQDVEPGFDFVGDQRAAALALAQGGAYRLRLGRDLDRAVALLKTLAA